MVPSAAITLAVSSVLAFWYLFAYARNRHRYLEIWTASWFVTTLRYSLTNIFIALELDVSSLSAVNHDTAILSGLLLMWGSYVFMDRKFPEWWVCAAILDLIWIMVGNVTGLDAFRMIFPTYTLLGAIYIQTGYCYVKKLHIKGAVSKFAGWAFIFWGVHAINQPFVRPYEWLEPWNYMISESFGFAVAIGVLLVYFKSLKVEVTEVFELKQAGERLKLLFEYAPDAYFLASLEGDFIDGNRSCEKLTGLVKSDMAGMNVLRCRLISTKQLPRVKKMLRKSALGAPAGPEEFALRREGGSRIDVEVRTYPVEMDGSVLVLGIARDVTFRRRAAAALVESERKYRSLVDNAMVGVYRTTLEGEILYANDALVEMLGYGSPEQLRAINVGTRYKDPGYRDMFLAALRKNNRVSNYDVELLTRTGRTVNAIMSATLEGDRLSGMVLDISDRRKLEEQLRHSQKLEAVGQLAGGVAHDFNNMLSAVMGYGSIILKKMKADDPLRHYVSHILDASERAAQLTGSLLAFSRKQDICPRAADLNGIIRNVEKLLSRLIGEDIEFKCSLSDGALMVMADAGQIEQVLMNLATNARAAMPGGGVLEISTRLVDLDARFLETHGPGEPGSYACITFSDSGHGMDDSTKRRIFEPFFTTKETGMGTGLGLSIIYGILRQHKGFINVYSELGIGTSFNLYLPTTDMEGHQDKRREPASPVMGGTETVLLAEDDETVREMVSETLRASGYRVVAASDGEEAVRKFKARCDEINAVLLDVIMPKKNGKEVYFDIKALRPGVKAIFMSGYTSDIIHRKGMSEQGIKFIAKPIMPDDLLKALKEVLCDRHT